MSATEGHATAQENSANLTGSVHPGDGVLTVVQAVLEIVVVAMFIVTFVLQPFRIPSESMQPTLAVGDFMLVNKQAFAPRGWMDAVLPPSPVKRGDVVVFHYPVDPSVHVVKRVVGLPGDRLRLRGGKLFVNGQAVAEPYAFYAAAIPDTYRDEFPAMHSMDANVDPDWWRMLHRDVRDGELTVPAGRYFVMGDNRNDSEDSRYWGFVAGPALVGRPMFVYFSLTDHAEGQTLRQRLTGVVHGARKVR